MGEETQPIAGLHRDIEELPHAELSSTKTTTSSISGTALLHLRDIRFRRFPDCRFPIN